MTAIAELMSADHRQCDEVFARAETLVAKGDWKAAAEAFEAFAAALNSHFDAEEDLLFPRFEAETGMRGGPTEVMRSEHREMRAALERLRSALAAADADDFAGEFDTLLILMQQHNMKEENILYPMCDARLGAAAPPLASELHSRLAARSAP